MQTGLFQLNITVRKLTKYHVKINYRKIVDSERTGMKHMVRFEGALRPTLDDP